MRIKVRTLYPVAFHTEMGANDAASSIGLTHDYLLVMRGAERTFAAMADCWPDAPLYTSVYSEDGTNRRFASRELKTSYLQFLRPRQSSFRWLLPLYPRAIESLPVQDHALLLSSSSAFAHGVRPRPDATHVCYCYTPFRYAWHERDATIAAAPRQLRPLLKRTMHRIRRWDREAAQRVTRYIAISELVRERIAACYDRDSIVVHPPVEVDRFSIGEPEDFFLVVAQLARHKRVEVALEAAERAGASIKVVGNGPALAQLQAKFPRASFLGRVSDDALADLYSRARALIVPNTEEFGIAAVEAQAAGRPVVALDAGGAHETVVDGVTGVLVPTGDDEAFAEVLRDVDFSSFSATRIRDHAQRFGVGRFKNEIVRAVCEPA